MGRLGFCSCRHCCGLAPRYSLGEKHHLSSWHGARGRSSSSPVVMAQCCAHDKAFPPIDECLREDARHSIHRGAPQDYFQAILNSRPHLNKCEPEDFYTSWAVFPQPRRSQTDPKLSSSLGIKYIYIFLAVEFLSCLHKNSLCCLHTPHIIIIFLILGAACKGR